MKTWKGSMEMNKAIIVIFFCLLLVACSTSDVDRNPTNDFLTNRVLLLERQVAEQQAVITRITSFMVELSNDYVLLERRVEVLE